MRLGKTAFVLLIILLSGCQTPEEAAAGIQDISLSGLNDGVYTGDSLIFPVKVRVNVTITQKKISSIEILEHFNGQGQKAETIVQDIIAAQSLRVDSITGATYSSVAIKKAVESALKR